MKMKCSPTREMLERVTKISLALAALKRCQLAVEFFQRFEYLPTREMKNVELEGIEMREISEQR